MVCPAYWIHGLVWVLVEVKISINKFINFLLNKLYLKSIVHLNKVHLSRGGLPRSKIHRIAEMVETRRSSRSTFLPPHRTNRSEPNLHWTQHRPSIYFHASHEVLSAPLNARSIRYKALALKDYMLSSMTWTFFTLTETWLQTEDSDNYTIAKLCPTGYSFHHIPREQSWGGGVGLLLKKRIQIKRQCCKPFKSFEYINVVIKCSNGHTRLAVIYRLPPSRLNGLNNKTFVDEFLTLVQQLAVAISW